MANIRTFKFPGIWAENANTVIPSDPIRYASYRNTQLDKNTIISGQNYGDIAKSSNYNQILYLITKFLTEVESQGIPSYSTVIDYKKGSICLSTNDEVYLCKLQNGPSNTVVDPASTANEDETYWISLTKKINSMQNVLDLFSNNEVSDTETLGSILTKLDSINTKVTTLKNTVEDLQKNNGCIKDIVYQSTAYTITEDDIHKVFICSGTFSITLPSAGSVDKGFNLYIKNNEDGVITIIGNIDGKTNSSITSNESVQLISDGTNWVSLHVASWISD